MSDQPPKKKALSKNRLRTMEVTITSREGEDPKELLRRVLEVLKEKQKITPKFVVTDPPAIQVRNEQLEAKATIEVADHLDKKAEEQKVEAKPGEPTPVPQFDAKKADEARGRIRKVMGWLWEKGVMLAVKAGLEWVKKLG